MQNTRSVAHVVGPDGEVLTLADLPPPDTVRWVPRKKARLVAAVCGGLISLNQACLRYRLTPEEFHRVTAHAALGAEIDAVMELKLETGS